MGLIYKTVKLSGAKGEREVKALFDIGAFHTFLQQTVAEAVAPLQALHRPLRFETATGIVEVILSHPGRPLARRIPNLRDLLRPPGPLRGP